MRAAAAEVSLIGVPTLCTDGACGMCGRHHALGWHASPLTWSDGSPAPLCRDCNRVWELRGSPTVVDDLRVVAI